MAKTLNGTNAQIVIQKNGNSDADLPDTTTTFTAPCVTKCTMAGAQIV